jgi:hypothetical protein
MVKIAFIVIAGILAHSLLMTGGGAANQLQSHPSSHGWASESSLSHETVTGSECSEIAPLLPSRGLRADIDCGAAVWPLHIAQAGPQVAASRESPHHHPPDTARALLQVYRI